MVDLSLNREAVKVMHSVAMCVQSRICMCCDLIKTAFKDLDVCSLHTKLYAVNLTSPFRPQATFESVLCLGVSYLTSETDRDCAMQQRLYRSVHLYCLPRDYTLINLTSIVGNF